MWILLGFVVFFVLTGLAYVIFTLMFVPGLAEERLGRLEDLPADDGTWREDTTSQRGRDAQQQGQRRETRYWIDTDWLGRERIMLQTRYIDRVSGELVQTEPDVRIRRRRIKA